MIFYSSCSNLIPHNLRLDHPRYWCPPKEVIKGNGKRGRKLKSAVLEAGEPEPEPEPEPEVVRMIEAPLPCSPLRSCRLGVLIAHPFAFPSATDLVDRRTLAALFMLAEN
jgi:hypothetical protein